MKIDVIRWVVILNNQGCSLQIFSVVLCVFIQYFGCLYASVLGAACPLRVWPRMVMTASGLFASSQERTLKQGPREANTNVHCSFLN